MTIQLIAVLIFVGASVAQGLFKYLAAQAEKRRVQQAQQRSELEILRTGRTSQAMPKAEAADGEARRREELAELRRRAAARREPQTSAPTQPQKQQTNRPTAATPLEILLGLPPGATSGGTVSPSARTSRPPKSRPAKGVNDPEAKRRRREQQRLRAEQAAAQARHTQEALEQKARASARMAAQVSAVEQQLRRDSKPTSTGRAPLGGIGIVPRSGAEWRRAIAINEVLASPIALR
ncbi:MAG: hypothetical protein ACREJD_02320 [Phycisphaerales bacterium]